MTRTWSSERAPVSYLALPLLLATAAIFLDPGRVLGQDPGTGSSVAAPGSHAEELLDFIKKQQKLHIRESTGELAFECFTEENLTEFRRTNVARAVSEEVSRWKSFQAIVAQLRAMPEEQRKTLLRKARQVAHPTWTEQGHITTDGSGQTWAGQKAERLLAGAIVDTAEEMLSKGTR